MISGGGGGGGGGGGLKPSHLGNIYIIYKPIYPEL